MIASPNLPELYGNDQVGEILDGIIAAQSNGRAAA
jgi:hypothetical protein